MAGLTWCPEGLSGLAGVRCTKLWAQERLLFLSGDALGSLWQIQLLWRLRSYLFVSLLWHNSCLDYHYSSHSGCQPQYCLPLLPLYMLHMSSASSQSPCLCSTCLPHQASPLFDWSCKSSGCWFVLFELRHFCQHSLGKASWLWPTLLLTSLSAIACLVRPV